MTSYVPEGFVLKPVLLLVYIDHVAAKIRCHCKASADHFKLYLYYPCMDDPSISLGVVDSQQDLDVDRSVSESWNHS